MKSYITLCLSLIVVAVLIEATPAPALLLHVGGVVTSYSYTPLCGGANPPCAYAYSTERQMVAGAPAAIVVQRSVDSTQQNIGFVTSGPNTGLVDTSQVATFCNHRDAGSGLISRNCYLQGIVDQTGNGCLMYQATTANMPNYMVDTARQGLPRFQKVWQLNGPVSPLTFLLDSNGGSTGALSNPCNLLTGGPQALFYAGNSTYVTQCCGQNGLMENTPGIITGTMFASFIGATGVTYDTCVITSPCGGLDTESQPPQANWTRAPNDDYISIGTIASGGALANVWVNGAQIITNETIPALHTQARMTWGQAGDHSQPGPNISRSETFYTSNLSSGQATALYSNETAFTASLTAGYMGPGDVIGGETQDSPGLSVFRVRQLMWLAVCQSLRKCWAGYEGPALNVCQGSGACEDIGWVNNTIDTATMSSFCGPVSGLNNCAVQIWYNEALLQLGVSNGVGTTLDAVAVSSANRPTIAWSGCGTTTITVCITTSPTNYFTMPSYPTGLATGLYPFTMSAVAKRTANTTKSAIFTSAGASAQNFIGFAASANNCTGTASNGSIAATVACTDGVVHSLTMDTAYSSSGPGHLYVDGTASSNVADYPRINASGGNGIGADGAGLNPCTCQISEFLLAADGYSQQSYGSALGSAGVAALLANQRAGFGF